jgi:hypothetical protein
VAGHGLEARATKNSHAHSLISRRGFVALLVASLTSRAMSQASNAPVAGRTLNFQINPGFGDASAADIEAVVRSAADSIWQHCPHTRWEVPGFFVYHSIDSPITLNDHRPDGRIAIGLTPQGNYWSQFAFQFAHEFGHALAGHSNDWHKPWIRGRKANHWLEESLCETASLFALRAMGKSWQTTPPFANWKAYAPHLTEYAEDRIRKVAKELPDGQSFAEWFAANEPAMRQNSTLREKNEVVAIQLLPLFEATPSGWESVTFYNLGKRDPNKSLAAQLADWSENVPDEQTKFVNQISKVLGL